MASWDTLEESVRSNAEEIMNRAEGLIGSALHDAERFANNAANAAQTLTARFNGVDNLDLTYQSPLYTPANYILTGGVGGSYMWEPPDGIDEQDAGDISSITEVRGSIISDKYSGPDDIGRLERLPGLYNPSFGPTPVTSITYTAPSVPSLEALRDITPVDLPPPPDGVDLAYQGPPRVSLEQPKSVAVNLPDPVDELDLAYTAPTPVGGFALGPIHQMDVTAQAPEWDLEAPTINTGGAPGALSLSPLGDAPVITDRNVDLTYSGPDDPLAPELLDWSVPSVTDLVLTPISVTSSDIAVPTAPNAEFAFTDEVYSSEQLTRMTEEVAAVLNGRMAIPDYLWDAIWARQAGQLARQAKTRMREARRAHAKLGWSLPGGVMLAQQEQAATDINEQISAAATEQAVQQAVQQREDFWKAVQSGTALETMLLQAHTAKQERALNAAIAEVDAAAKIYNISAAMVNLQIAKYEREIEQAKLVFQQDMARLEHSKLELEAAKTAGEVNQQRVQVYVAQWEGVKAALEKLKTEADVARLAIETDRSRVELFGQLVANRKSEVDAWTAQWQGYAAKLQAEQTKGSIYESSARAFGERMKAFAINSDTEKARVEADVQRERLRLEASNRELEEYKAAWMGIQSTLEILTKKYAADVERYNARVQGSIEQARTAVETEKLIQSNNQAKVAQFEAETRAESSRIDAGARVYDAQARMHQTKVEAISRELQNAVEVEKARATLNQAKVAQYEAEVRGRTADVQAQSAKAQADIQAYTAVVQAESEKIRANAAQIQAVAQQNQAVASETASLAQIAASVEQSRLNATEASYRAASAQASAEAARAGVEAEAERLKIAKQDADTRRYVAELDAEKAKMQATLTGTELDLKKLQAEVTLQQGAVSISTMEKELALATSATAERLNMDQMAKLFELALKQRELSMQASRDTGLIYAQIAQAAYAAANVSLGADAGFNTSASASQDYNYTMNADDVPG